MRFASALAGGNVHFGRNLVGGTGMTDDRLAGIEYGDEPPVLVGAVLVVHPGRVPVHVTEERLLTVVDHLHRPARVQREHAGVHVHRQVLTPAERTADAGQGDPHQLLVEAERVRHLAAVDVQPLGRDVQVDPAVRRRHREAGLGTEERLVLHADLVVAGHHHRGAHRRVAPPDACVPHDVAAEIAQRLAEAVGPALERVRELKARSGVKVLLALKCFSTWGVFDLMSEAAP